MLLVTVLSNAETREDFEAASKLSCSGNEGRPPLGFSTLLRFDLPRQPVAVDREQVCSSFMDLIVFIGRGEDEYMRSASTVCAGPDAIEGLPLPTIE